VFFRHCDNVNSDQWQCVSQRSAAETVVNTTIAANTNENTFRIVINAAATSITFYINGVAQTAITTNINTSDNFVPMVSIKKSVGTTARQVSVDYIKMTTTRT